MSALNTLKLMRGLVSNTLGFKWKETDSEASSRGTEFKNESLAKALESQVEFKKEEWDTFEVDNLSNDSYIKVGDTYFKPADNNVIADMSFPHGQADTRGYREYGMDKDYNIRQHKIACGGGYREYGMGEDYNI